MLLSSRYYLSQSGLQQMKTSFLALLRKVRSWLGRDFWGCCCIFSFLHFSNCGQNAFKKANAFWPQFGRVRQSQIFKNTTITPKSRPNQLLTVSIADGDFFSGLVMESEELVGSEFSGLLLHFWEFDFVEVRPKCVQKSERILAAH
jgi:hypothetical protein